MSEVYRKFGRSLRYENGTIVRADEAGEAIEDAQAFNCRPIEHSVELAPIDARAVEDTVREIHSIVRAPLKIERLIVSEGITEHQFGERRWRESMRRIHVAMTFRTLRAVVDLGDFDLGDIRLICGALPRAVPVSEAGNESATVDPGALLGPALLTVMV